MDLNDRDRATLDLEAGRWKHQGLKDAVIRERFDESPTRYYQRLHALLGKPAALAYAPGTVRRLQRLRDARHAARIMNT